MFKTLVAPAVLAAFTSAGFAATTLPTLPTVTSDNISITKSSFEDGSTIDLYFGANQSQAWKITFAKGTYDIALPMLLVDSSTKLTNAWLSSSRSSDPTKGLFTFALGTKQADDNGMFAYTPTGLWEQTFTTKTSIYLDVTGKGFSKAANATGYGGLIEVTAVPEPATSALFLAGLGAMGLMARRRKISD